MNVIPSEPESSLRGEGESRDLVFQKRSARSFASTGRFASESSGFAQDDILETVSPSFSAGLGR